MKKRVFSMFLALIMVLGMLPATALAVEPDVATFNGTGYSKVQDAVDAAVTAGGTVTVEIIADTNEEVTIPEAEGLHLTLKGSSANTFSGKILIKGNSGYENGSTTIQGITFDAKNLSGNTGDDACIYVPWTDGAGSTYNLYRYSQNVTVSGCTFKDSGNDQNAVAMKQATSGCKNWTVTGCTVESSMHSLLQLAGVDGVQVTNTKVYSKHGINLVSSDNIQITGSTFEVSGYCVRTGANSGGLADPETISVSNTSLKTTAADEGAIVLRGSGDNAEITLSGVTVEAVIDIQATDSAKGANATISGAYKTAEGVWTVGEVPELPTATVTKIEKDDLTFALNFKADEPTAEQLAYYGNWYADFVLTVNTEVTFNADSSTSDGWLSGQYDEWSENWVNVPAVGIGDVTLQANESLKIMAFAAEAMGQSGLNITYNDVVSFVKDFDCGVFFTEAFKTANPDLKVTLSLRMYNPADETESYIIGEEYVFTLPKVHVSYYDNAGNWIMNAGNKVYETGTFGFDSEKLVNAAAAKAPVGYTGTVIGWATEANQEVPTITSELLGNRYHSTTVEHLVDNGYVTVETAQDGSKSVKFYAVYAPADVTVYWLTNDGFEQIMKVTKKYTNVSKDGQSIGMLSEKLIKAANEEAPEGYSWLGWAFDAGATKAANITTNSHQVKDLVDMYGVKLQEDAEGNLFINVYAVWKANEYTVTFDPNGGDALNPNTKGVTFDAAYGELPTPTKPGYKFTGWTDAEGKVVTAETIYTIADDSTLTAQWNVKKCEVYYYLDGVEVKSFTLAGEDTLAYNVYDYQPEKTGYTLDCWYEAQKDIGNANKAEPNVKQNLADKGKIRLYGKYTANEYIVTFIDDGKTVDTQDFVYDVAQNLKDYTATKTGYTFAGWDINGDGVVDYANGASAQNLTAEPNGNVELVAVWDVNKHTVTYKVTGSWFKMERSFSDVAYGSVLNGLQDNMDRDGYKFYGWFLNGDETTPFVPGEVTMPDNDLLITGYYKRDIAKATVVLDPESFTFNGKDCKPVVTVSFDDGKCVLAENADYTIGFTGDTINAGTVTITITAMGDNYYGETSVTFEIAKAKATLSITAADAVYDGNEHGVTYSVKDIDGKEIADASVAVQYYKVVEGVRTEIDYVPVDAGDYAAAIYYRGNTNYDKQWEGYAEYTIEKAEATLDITAADAVYDGNEHGVTYSVKGVDGKEIADASVAVQYYKVVEGARTEIDYVPVDAGDYAAAIYYRGNTNYNKQWKGYAEYTIEKAEYDVDVVVPQNAVYNGDEQPATVTVKGVKGDDITADCKVSVAYNDSEGNKVDGAPVDADTYYVTVHVAESANYKAVYLYRTAEYTIAKAEYDVDVVVPQNAIYNGGEQPATVTVKGVKGDDITADCKVSVAYDDSEGNKVDGAPVDADTYYVTVHVAESANYNAVYLYHTAEYTIAPADINTATVTVADGEYIYNGNKHTPAVTVEWNGKTLVEGKDYTVSYKNNTDAGEATVTVTGINNFTNSVDKTFVIKPMPITVHVTAENQTKTYNGNKQSLEVKFTWTIDEIDSNKLDVVYKGEGVAFTDAGSKSLKAEDFEIASTASRDAKNYSATITLEGGTLTIKPAPVDVIVKVNSETKTYTGSELSMEVVATYEITGTKKAIMEYIGDAVVGTDVGTYNVDASKFVITSKNSYSKNYTLNSLTVEGGVLTIVPAEYSDSFYFNVKTPNGQPLSGAKFGLYSDAECKNLVTEATSDKDGKVVFTVKVTDDTVYYAKQISAPYGYIADTGIYSVTLTTKIVAGENVGGFDATMAQVKARAADTPAEEFVIINEQAPIYYPVVNPTPTVTVKGLNTTEHMAYIIGSGDGKVNPLGTISRAEVATIFFRLMDDNFRAKYWDNDSSYADVADDAWYNVAVATLENAGIIKDTTTGGNFRPTDLITRAELAVMAAQFANVSGTIPATSFADVPATYWAAAEIAVVQFAGWIEGNGGYYRPDANLTRAECMTIVNRMLQRGAEAENMLADMTTFSDNIYGTWYYEAVQEATNSHTYTRTVATLTGENFRGEKWVKIEAAPDWAALEKAWAEGNK